jgi:hypothetical protein
VARYSGTGRRCVWAGKRKGEGDRGSQTRARADGGGVAAMLPSDVADEEETKAGAFDPRDGGASRDAVKAIEDALELVGG